jgi:hypothetical protein
MDIAALHGHAERRDLGQSQEILSLREAMLDRVAEGWRLRRIVSVATRAVLERELAVIADVEARINEPQLEVRALVTDSVPILAPLIIDGRCAILATEDPGRFGAYEGIVFTDIATIDLCQRYFDSLWSDERAIRVRTPGGLRENEVERLQAEIDALLFYEEHRARSGLTAREHWSAVATAIQDYEAALAEAPSSSPAAVAEQKDVLSEIESEIAKPEPSSRKLRALAQRLGPYAVGASAVADIAARILRLVS